jgi:transposase-like protein
MGLFVRKLISLGPLALNFSKSGIGISAGVRGLRAFKQIRTILEDGNNPLGGSGKAVEMDEAYMGGKRKRRTGLPMGGAKVKTAVVGIVERQGRLKAIVADDVKGSTLLGMVKEHILPKSVVFTDELNPYHGIEHMPNMSYAHKRIHHVYCLCLRRTESRWHVPMPDDGTQKIDLTNPKHELRSLLALR